MVSLSKRSIRASAFNDNGSGNRVVAYNMSVFLSSTNVSSGFPISTVFTDTYVDCAGYNLQRRCPQSTESVLARLSQLKCVENFGSYRIFGLAGGIHEIE
jgi:hypothetical protein